MVVVFNLLLAAMVGITLIISLVQRGLRRVGRVFNMLGFCLLGWLLSDAAYYAAGTPDAMMALYNLKMPFVAFCPVALFILVLLFYRQEKYASRRLRAALCVVPGITAVMAATTLWHPFLRRVQYVVQVRPLHVMYLERGWWYWVHTAYSYLLVLGALALLLAQHRKLPRGYRAPSAVLLLAVIITVCSNIVHFLPFISLGFDVTPAGMSLSFVFIYVAAASASQTDLLEIARDNILIFWMNTFLFWIWSGRWWTPTAPRASG